MEASEKRGLPNGTQEKKKSEMPGMPKDLLYSVDEVPPLGLCILLGFQHYLTAFGGIVSVPLIMNKFFCMGDDYVGLSQLIGTLFFVSGICTLLQTTFGVRLPIIQGGTFTLVGPVIAIMSLPKWKDSCPFLQEEGTYNATDLPPTGGAEHKELWQQRLREVQGDIMLASIFQVVIGFTGLMGFITRFIGPLAVVPTISLIGLALFNEAAALASKQWYIAIMTIFLILLFSQYLRNFSIPICKCSRKGCGVMKLPIFKLFPVLLGMIASWVICSILTVAGVLTDDVDSWGYAARTDTKISVLNEAAWFRFPYPGQWGTPTASVAGVFGVLAGIIGSMIESVGDYYACARLSGAPPPPVHAMNRGIGMEGVGCVIAGAFGTGNATTSYSENVGAIGITKVGSRRVVQVGGIIMLILGCLNKFGALFVTIPDPVIGGMFLVTFGMVVAVGLSNLQYVDLSSPRNICILGLSIFFGLSFPLWVRANPSSINTGSATLDQILVVLLETNMFIGGFVGFVLDLTVPGTEEERGIKKWRAVSSIRGDVERSPVYDFPLVQKFFNRIKCFRFLPFCPSFINCCERHTNYDVDSHGNENEAYDDATESRNRTPMNDTQF